MRGLAKLNRKLNNLIPEGKRLQKGLRAVCVTGTAKMREVYGDEDIAVSYEVAEETAEIKAKGEELLFVEFGTGYLKNVGTSYGNKLGYTPKSWSATHEHFLTDPRKVKKYKGRWPHGGLQEGEQGVDAFGVTMEFLKATAGRTMRDALKR